MEIEPIIGQDFVKKVIPLIDNAKNSIKVVVFDWRWYPNHVGSPAQLFNQAFVRAGQRGVHIQAILNNDYVGQFLNSQNIQIKRTISKTLVHAKMILIDNTILVIGSHNYTESAFTMNREISVLITGLDNFSEYDKFFQHLWLS